MGPKGPMHGDARSASTYTWFCSASCRVNYNYVVSLHFFFDYQIRKTQLLAFKFQSVESQFEVVDLLFSFVWFSISIFIFCFRNIDILFVIFHFTAEPSSCCFPFFNFEFQRFGFHVWFPIWLFPILRLSHPRQRLRSFSIAARRFVSRWVHSVVACFTWFCSASCRVRFNYVVPLCSLFIFNFENTCLAFRFQHVF